MVPSQAELLARIKAFLNESGMSPTAFGRHAVGDGTLLRRLRKHSCTLATADRIERFMATWSRAP